MSWTLIRHKDGQEVPIKVSVLDAFRSSSGSTRHINTKAASFKKVNSSVPKVSGPGTSTAASTSSSVTKTATSNTRSTSAPETWTEEDDELLRESKTANLSWKQILVKLGDAHNSETQAKARWKEIEGKPVVNGETITGGEDQKSKKPQEKKEKAKAEGLAKQAAANGGKGGGAKGKEKKKNTAVSKNGDDSSSSTAASQNIDMKSMAARYDKDKWLALASRHFDRTGQRISPEMAKQMCSKS